MDTVTVSEKGQMIIPAGLRRKLGISAGSRLAVLPEAGGFRVTVEPARKKLTAKELAGTAGYIGSRVSDEEMDAARFVKTP
ncbi:MAG: AbrB/MazE/SpoVT family DNA-binding domain-containing protein [Nitrospirae bacterium]|nr:AbrB/MazE/SpoVT family DNA-binding domain-containing protein [Nitrospirota bacterium]